MMDLQQAFPYLLFAMLMAVVPACQSSGDQQQAPNFVQTGEASYYHPSLEGGQMASGQAFRNDSPYAAHRHLPLGTEIQVTNLANDSIMQLVVMDRGPYAKDRILDVSGTAADALDFRHEGHTEVRIEAVLAEQLADSLREVVPVRTLSPKQSPGSGQ